MARDRGVSSICRHRLTLARSLFGTAIPDQIIERLAAGDREPSAAYLAEDRRWMDELGSAVRHLQGWRARLSHLRQVLFPGVNYMQCT